MKVAVIGAGSWGTALAQVLGENGHNVGLWARRSEVVQSVNADHVNPRYLSDVRLSDNVVATLSHQDAVLRARAALVVTPSSMARGVARALADCVDQDFPVCICSKGVEAESGLLSTQVFAQEMGNPERFAVLSGPNHAEEIIKGIPAGTVIASESTDTAQLFQELLAGGTLRTYVSNDVKGVQLCGAYKNIIAIAVGAAYGLGFGDNTASLLLTRGLAEMSRLIAAAGGDPLTCLGLAGTGDMVATCMSRHSRNRTFGEKLAGGMTLEQYKAETHMVVEGALACKTIQTLADRYHVELPIANIVRGIVWEGERMEDAAEQLLSRELKQEFYGI
ncbi:MAG: NAD(P)H-dependent glycerol-3-phosphate dehydrogenase [Coriobacteriia bacterium]|nr:NAD(P)H-dependent glycerol-3-phosphate dehydrogenase [Coriobacteriia bacterium]